jgi:hypothetical protein
MRVRKYGGLVDVNKLGAVVITPFAGQSVGLNGPTSIAGATNITGALTVTGAVTQNGAVRQTVVVPLSAAQLIAMGTTPVSLRPAPGAGKCIIVDNVTFKMVTTATVFTGGGAVEIRYTNAAGTIVAADIAAGVITAGAGTSFTNVRGIEASLTGVANAPIVITNADAPFAAGTGTAVVVIDYHIV